MPVTDAEREAHILALKAALKASKAHKVQRVIVSRIYRLSGFEHALACAVAWLPKENIN